MYSNSGVNEKMKQRFQFEFYTVPMCMKAKNEKKLHKKLQKHRQELFENLRWTLL